MIIFKIQKFLFRGKKRQTRNINEVINVNQIEADDHKNQNAL